MAAEAETNFTIQWHITERCNCRCLHCYQEESTAESSSEQLERVRNDIESFLGERKGIITITGGEPLLHPHICSLLGSLRHPFAVLTNGTLIDQSMARELAEYSPSFVQVSIEGREQTHDLIRGRGTFKAAVEGIKNLIRAEHRVLISFTAHRRNYRDLPAVARIGRQLGVDKVWVDRLIPAGSGSTIEGLDSEQTRELFYMMRKSRVAMDRALQFLAGGSPYKCQAGRKLMAILPSGDVLPCRRMPITAGNLNQNTLEEIYQGDLMKSLRAEASSECRGCLYEKICKGGLRCLAYAVTGSFLKPDPSCWIAHALQTRRNGHEQLTPVEAIIGRKRPIWKGW